MKKIIRFAVAALSFLTLFSCVDVQTLREWETKKAIKEIQQEIKDKGQSGNVEDGAVQQMPEDETEDEEK